LKLDHPFPARIVESLPVLITECRSSIGNRTGTVFKSFMTEAEYLGFFAL